jgi:hypothetical protein
MKNKIFIFLSLSIFLLLQIGCSLNMKKALQRGEVIRTQFDETVEVEVMLGLIIVPVTINGKTYRFLLDTGAPFSISERLQSELNYKVISKGNIVDTEHNRKKVNYVELDSIFIGNIPFTNQTALVLGFQSNPKLKCMDLDGIVGSNLMRHCNWKIDFENKAVSLSNIPDAYRPGSGTTVAFKTDKQFNILLDVEVGIATIHSTTLDYGSNGSLSVPSNDFNILKENNIIDTVFLETGVSQKGILGEINKLTREFSYADTIKSGNLAISEVEIGSGNSKLLGCQILSRYAVSIDWENQNLHFSEVDSMPNNNLTYGFGVGYSEERQVYVQSVIENSPAYKNNIRPLMQILKLDSLDLSSEQDFCDLIRYRDNMNDSITLELMDSLGVVRNIRMGKIDLNN